MQDQALTPGQAKTEKARAVRLRQQTLRAVDDPAVLARAARIIRAALERNKITLADLTDEAESVSAGDGSMTAADRNALIRIVRGRARLARSAAAEREKILQAEVQDLIQTEYEARDMIKAGLRRKAQEAVAEANRDLLREAELLGVPERFAPKLELGYRYSHELADKERRAELVKLASTRLAALKASAVRGIEEAALAAEESLIISGLESSEARWWTLCRQPSS